MVKSQDVVIVVEEFVDVDDVVDVEDCFINSKDAHFIGDKMGVFLSRPTYNSRTRDVAMYCYIFASLTRRVVRRSYIKKH